MNFEALVTIRPAVSRSDLVGGLHTRPGSPRRNPHGQLHPAAESTAQSSSSSSSSAHPVKAFIFIKGLMISWTAVFEYYHQIWLIKKQYLVFRVYNRSNSGLKKLLKLQQRVHVCHTWLCSYWCIKLLLSQDVCIWVFYGKLTKPCMILLCIMVNCSMHLCEWKAVHSGWCLTHLHKFLNAVCCCCIRERERQRERNRHLTTTTLRDASRTWTTGELYRGAILTAVWVLSKHTNTTHHTDFRSNNCLN